MSKLKKNILFITTWYPHEENIYQGTFVKDHAKAVSKYSDVVLFFAYGLPNFRKLYEVDESFEEGIRVYRIRFRHFPKGNMLIKVLLMLKIFRSLRRTGIKFDLIHAHVFYSGLPAAIISWLYGIPFILTEHFSRISLKTLSKSETWILKFVGRRAARIITISQSLQTGMESYGLRSRFEVIPNPVDTDLFSPGEVQSSRNRRKEIVFVGSLEPIKGLQYALSALALVQKRRRDFYLTVIGDGSKRAEYEEMASTLYISQCIGFLGRKSKAEVAGVIRKSDLLISASEWETMGCVLVEALASGIPVIAPKVGGITEILTEEYGILFEPRNSEMLARSIDYMLDNHSKFNKTALEVYAKSRFSLAAIGNQINRVYEMSIANAQ